MSWPIKQAMVAGISNDNGLLAYQKQAIVAGLAIKNRQWLLAWLPETGNGCWAILSEHALVANSLAGLTTSKFLRQNIDPALEVVNVHITALKRKKSQIYYQYHV